MNSADLKATMQLALTATQEITKRDCRIAALERELAEAKAAAADAESQAERERSQRQMEIGGQEYRGNTISYIYDKCANYGRQAANIIRERDEALAERDRLRKALEDAVQLAAEIICSGSFTSAAYEPLFARLRDMQEALASAEKGEA